MLQELCGDQEWCGTLAEQAVAAGSTAASGIRGDNPDRKALLPSQVCCLQGLAFKWAFHQDHRFDQPQLQSLSEGEVATPRLGALGPFRDHEPLGGDLLLRRL